MQNKLGHPVVIFLLCWIAYAISYFGRMNLAIAMPTMEANGVASFGQLGIAGSLFFWCYGCGHLINGFLGDKFSPRLMVFWGLLISGGVNLAVSLIATPVALMVLWSLNGLVLSMLWGPMIRLLGEWVPAEKQGQAALLMSMSIGIGSFFCWRILGAIVVKNNDWHLAFFIPAVLCSGFAVVWLLLCRERHSRYYKEELKDSTATAKESFLALFIKLRLYLIVFAAMFQGVIKDGLTLWLPSLMQASYPDIKEEIIVERISLLPLANLTGLLIISFFVARRTSYKKEVIILFLVCALLLSGLSLSPPFLLAIVFLCILSFLILLINSILLGYLPMRFRRSGRISTVAGLLDFAAYFASGIFSIVSGAYFQKGEGNVFIVLLFCVLCGAVVMSQVNRKIDQ